MKVDVYRNLNDDCWSVRSRETENYGIVIEHADALAVTDAEFVVQPAGQQRAMETGVKNVHAFVRGKRWDGAMWPGPWEQVEYDPLEVDHFRYADDGEEAEGADIVLFLPDGAFVPERGEPMVKP